MAPRRKLTQADTVEAVKLVTHSGYSVAHAARLSGFQESTLRYWVRKAQRQGVSELPDDHEAGPWLSSSEIEERRQLSQERFLSKASQIAAEDTIAKYVLVAGTADTDREHPQVDRLTVEWMCKTLGIQTSGYYRWKQDPQPRKASPTHSASIAGRSEVRPGSGSRIQPVRIVGYAAAGNLKDSCSRDDIIDQAHLELIDYAESHNWLIANLFADKSYQTDSSMRRHSRLEEVSERSPYPPGLEAALRFLAEQRADLLLTTDTSQALAQVTDPRTLAEHALKYKWVLAGTRPSRRPKDQPAQDIFDTFSKRESEWLQGRVERIVHLIHPSTPRSGRRNDVIPRDLIKSIAEERESGHTWEAICERLNAERVPTIRGGRRWRINTLSTLYNKYVEAPDRSLVHRRRRDAWESRIVL